MTRRSLTALTAASLLALALLTACGDNGDDGGGGGGGDAATAGGALEGTLAFTAGECEAGGVEAGSWFRMVEPEGDATDGPFVLNPDSPCGDKTWTPLSPGTDGGLVIGGYQPLPDPAFDERNNAVVDILMQPQTFFAVDFSAATNETDPQTGEGVPPPTLDASDDGSLSGDLSAFAAAWNGEHFNQGAPKPGGDRPPGTQGPAGRYDAGAGTMSVEWTSLIVGGAFDGFTGVWHLEGTFQPSG